MNICRLSTGPVSISSVPMAKGRQRKISLSSQANLRNLFMKWLLTLWINKSRNEGENKIDKIHYF